MGMNVKTDGLADVGQSVEDIERYKYLIADASDIDDDLPGQLMRQSSANLCNHCELGSLGPAGAIAYGSLRRRIPGRQSGTASSIRV